MRSIDEIFWECGLSRGRCFGNKSAYRSRNQHSIFLSNACVCNRHTQIWGGDLDLSTQDASGLILAAKILGESLYVLSERVNKLSGPLIQKYAEFVVSEEHITITEMGLVYVPKLPAGAIIVARRG